MDSDAVSAGGGQDAGGGQVDVGSLQQVRQARGPGGVEASCRLPDDLSEKIKLKLVG